MSEIFDRSGAAAFDDVDVARCYQFRPAYPQALYHAMLELSPDRGRALDLGCGTGKLAGWLAEHFDRVDAVDPSRPMLEVAASSYPNPRIRWLESTAEDATLDPPYDLICAGASIHWLDHERLMPRLAASLSESARLMVIDGDGAWQPPWQAQWSGFIARWLEHMGRRHNETEFGAAMNRYQEFMVIEGRGEFVGAVEQSPDDFIECQHSRATWAREKLGPEPCRRFDAELKELLTPHLRGGVLHFLVRTTLTWGRPNLLNATTRRSAEVPNGTRHPDG